MQVGQQLWAVTPPGADSIVSPAITGPGAGGAEVEAQAQAPLVG